MNASQPSLASAKHYNRGLFSDYYLDQIVPTLPEWVDDNGLFAQARNLRDELRALLNSLQPEALDESQLEEQWVKPVLEKLGHHWSVQVKIRYRESGYRKPDYVFTSNADEARAFTNEIYGAAHIAHALALGDAKKWGVPLDQASGKERNPSQQIDEYLRYSELKWGILTDGRVWRLYQRDSSKDNTYYAVDLVEVLQADDLHDFYYFLLFFRRQAFSKSGWLEQLLQGSIDYAEGLSDELEDEVYYALEQIAQGFLNYRRNRLTPDPATLRTVYEQSLVLLYRLLFVLYAESRDVLPMSTNVDYADHRSLRALNSRVKNRIEGETRVNKMAVDDDSIYASLSALFFAIDVGSPEYGIAPYNGRLFSEAEHPFLAGKAVGDAFLVPALDRLARVDATVRSERTPRRVFVDYRDLDVRHLGAIYEKLLEYQLEIATVPLTLRGGKYEPANDSDEVIKQPGEVYLRGGNNERKITGSYYTPDYIVRFIVERTLEPLLSEITEQYAALDAEGHWQVRDSEGLRQAILNLNILDPATGSGHFMVEAVAYLAEWLRGLGLHPADLDADEDELVYWKRQVVTACIYGVDVNPLAVELAKLSLWLTTIQRGKPLSFLDHHVKVGNTLVGARLREIGRGTPPPGPLPEYREGEAEGQNPADAKNGVPTGVGTGFIPSAETPSPVFGGGLGRGLQLPLFQEASVIKAVSDAVQKMNAIETAVVTTVKNVKAQERTYRQLHKTMNALRQLADVWVARHFGMEMNGEAWQAIYEGILTPSPVHEGGLGRGLKALLKQAGALADDYHFFHWELEFPEVFFAPDGKPLAQAGFDAVVGNPPYVRQERIQPIKPYLQAHYEVYAGTADLFLYFYERALKLVKPARRLGYITSGTFMNSNSAVAFRQYLHANAAFETVVNFGENQPFKGAEMVYPTIAILKNGKPAPSFRSLFVEDVYRRAELGNAVRDLPLVETASDVTALDEWRFQSVELTRLFRKITEGYETLGEAIDGQIYYGIKTGLNEAFIINDATRQRLTKEHPSSAGVIKPIRGGEDLRPWYQIDSQQYLVWTYQGIEIDKHPAIKQYLMSFQTALAKRSDAANIEWYELRPCDYYGRFEKPKVLWPIIGKLPRFSWDIGGVYVKDTGFILVLESLSTLALLQSRALWFALSQIATPLRLRAGLWQYQGKSQFVERLPIPALTAAQESGLAALAEEITGLARGRYHLHEGMRKRIGADLGADASGKLNEKLENWWELDFGGLRAEVRKAFKRDITVSERDEWERYLADQQAKHAVATHDIIQHEIRLNAIIYEAFKLTTQEIALIEQATKYPYGAV